MGGDVLIPKRSRVGDRLSVSQNGRYLRSRDGTPFFYLADTAWTLFKRLDRSDVDVYLTNRADKGFTVIQAYVLRGLDVPNLDGHHPLVGRDPTKLNEGFFQNVDHIVNRANDLGLVMGLVTTMGEHVKHEKRFEHFGDRNEQIFDMENAFAYGALLGERYKNNCVIWYLGGDRSPDANTLAVWDAMARGLKTGSGRTQLVSYHSSGGRSSSEYFQACDWLDFNAVQSFHRSADPNYAYVAADYALVPVKPTLDIEARYEDHPDMLVEGLSRTPSPTARIDAFQVREAAYWAVLAGACGHGYGHNDIWQMHDDRRLDTSVDYSFPILPARGNWHASMDSAGAVGVGYMRKLMELRPWYVAEPDQSVIAAGQGSGEDHIQARRARDGSFVIVYLTFGNPVVIMTDGLSGRQVKALWYDPRLGTFAEVGRYLSGDALEFVPPTHGPGQDWVLVVETADSHYPIS
ncbi:MAG: glycoside hydrolase family 140 protein [Fimbriimonadales bacterium]